MSVIGTLTHSSLCELILAVKCRKQNNKEWGFFVQNQPILYLFIFYYVRLTCFFLSQMLYSYGFLHNGPQLSAPITAFEFARTQDRAYGLLLQSADKLLLSSFFGLYQRFLRTSSGSFSALKRAICRPPSMHLRPNTQERRTEGEKKKKIIIRRQSCPESLDGSKNPLYAGGRSL